MDRLISCEFNMDTACVEAKTVHRRQYLGGRRLYDKTIGRLPGGPVPAAEPR